MTKNRTLSGLRNSAAMLITASGLGLIALLWFRELSGTALIDALQGTIYLFIGIGLLGQSRFSLCVAIVIPAAAAALVLQHTALAELGRLQITRIVIDGAVILIALVVLWQVRNDPSV